MISVDLDVVKREQSPLAMVVDDKLKAPMLGFNPTQKLARDRNWGGRRNKDEWELKFD